MTDEVEERSEDDEASQGCSGFVRSQSDAVVCFEARKEILHFMAMPVDAPVKGCGLIVEFKEALAGNGAAGGPMLAQCLAEAQAVEPLVSHKMNVAKGGEHLARRSLIMQVARGQDEGAEVASFIHGSQQLGRQASARKPDGLCLAGLFAALQPVLVELDVAAIDMPQRAFGLLRQPRQQGIPETAEAPPAELRVDRAPRAELGWHLTPWRACAQDEIESFQMRGNHFGPSPASRGPFFKHYRMNEEALSRRASSRLRVVLLNMAPSQRAPFPSLSKLALFAKTPLSLERTSLRAVKATSLDVGSAGLMDGV